MAEEHKAREIPAHLEYAHYPRQSEHAEHGEGLERVVASLFSPSLDTHDPPRQYGEQVDEIHDGEAEPKDARTSRTCA
eukprot:scaffold189122_cov30-Tisochrysis_lutea.AAC.3